MEGGQEIAYQDHIFNESPVHEITPSETVRVSSQIPKLDDRSKKLLHLRTCLEKDPKAADIKWSLFVAACQSYRYDSILRPFPPAFLKENNYKDIDSLLRVIEDTPPLSLLLHQIHDPDICQVHDHVIDLLHWVVITMREPYLKTLDKECYDSVLSRVPCQTPIPKPNFIFQVVSSIKTPAANRWRVLGRDRTTLFAYHGSKLENFHSIIHYGLQQHLNKNGLFGKGIYLTSELSVSLPYSPSGYAWGGSKCGSELSCIALCEFIDNEDYVKCQRSTDLVPNKGNRNKDPDSIGGEVPNKYYVISNSDMVRVRYLLIYSKPNNTNNKPQSSFFGWFGRHKLLTFLLGYGVLLSAIGILNNVNGQYLYHMVLKKIQQHR